MESQLWAIAIRTDQTTPKPDPQMATVDPFKVPVSGLRVGTLDSLMSLSDDLSKMDILAEATVAKIYKQLTDLKPDEEPTVNGVPPVVYTTKYFEWDEAKFQTKMPLRELTEGISMRISALDEELKLKVTEMNNLKGILQGIDRKTQGNLMVRGLADIVQESDVMESDYMTTLYVVVPKASLKEFVDSYEKMATYVVPKSAKLLSEDSEYGLYTCIIFKKSLEEFKASAREKRLTLREFTFDAGALEAERVKKESDTAEFERMKGMLSKWCGINYAECYMMMLHLKVVRVFVESVLRYGLTTSYSTVGMVPNFKAYVLQPKKGMTEKLRKELATMYGGPGNMGAEEEEMVVPGAQGEFYPYVYTSIETEPQVS